MIEQILCKDCKYWSGERGSRDWHRCNMLYYNPFRDPDNSNANIYLGEDAEIPPYRGVSLDPADVRLHTMGLFGCVMGELRND